MFANSFAASDFITIIGEISPDTTEIGTSGNLYVVLLSFVGDQQVWVNLTADGSYIPWNLKISGLEAVQRVTPLEESHTITIFEEVLEPGRHRISIGYKADNGVLIYAPEGRWIDISE